MLHCKVMPNWSGYFKQSNSLIKKGKVKWNFKRLISQNCST
jgi:hypothetical protein